MEEVRQARVRFTDGNTSVSGIFTFMKSTYTPLMFQVDNDNDTFLIYKWFCTYSDWTRIGDYQVPRRATEGIINMASQDRRLNITVTGLDFER